MKSRLINTLLVLLLCAACVGFARGWFALSKSSDTDGSKVNINLTVDPDKVKTDVKQVEELPRRITKEAEKAGEHAAGE